ncbi:hypothetical protein MFRU_007g02750 [Monilinia fructicola]|uniref:N-acetyltransferase domain-containing protein n=1 Tax=Monilinia fructicola TaxID=38448 RepID=A0A5M9JC72_MONFR|nr:hypothetical protein EYC84_010256 [Monilinia fructicola]KAG4032371.1 hypothetical protein MFRU_007g02750 [Monilinia fructicola]
MSFEIVHISTADLVRFYVGRYKEFRLLSLQIAPEAFASKYAREVEFSDEVWYQRLANPDAGTFFAIQASKIVGTVTILGPLPDGYEPDDLDNPWQAMDDEPKSKRTTGHHRINGMFTLPEVRGQGVGRGLVEAALRYAGGEMAAQGKAFVCSVVVESDNIPARSLYEKCSFVPFKEVPYGNSNVTVMRYQVGQLNLKLA